MIYDYEVKNIKQENQSLEKYKGQVFLVVNTATKCGYTKQYEGLESLYQDYKDKGFEVLDFPCNQFLMQAPGSDEELAEFCQLNYFTTFETFSKVKVNGKDASPLFDYLKEQLPVQLTKNKDGSLEEETTKRIKWNFTKFLIDRNGNVVKRFAPNVTPDMIKPYIEELL
ncbi:Glutathione peroxidase [Alteracholeplasma palmae J233]|uniref:Glutathione peroxidase n=1 Tax=Alteracholeplasma palmae (strain ATCC 49389 / J233) TaxID=1318466 RepID=U4KL74_ALTPJ|nr:glutathione peroxidase [Alteracholeplasma palmae]CCV64527.1 Glutathione peroxidase [Alteracholeplasma palmae J233]